jgi:ElaB/YqjD/DUF883 family membrane-anchored ribosome-binding protein
MLEPAQQQTTRSREPQPSAASEQRQPQDQQALGVTESADLAMQSVGSLYSAVEQTVSKHVRERPYATLAAAAGVGFVLGGGMRSPFGQFLVRVGVRAFGPPLVSAALHNAVERAQGLTQQEPSTGE